MSMEQSEALVIRVFPWSETSCIANLYTRDFGKLSVLAKGARRPKSPFEAALDLLSICRVVFIPKSSDALDILTEAKLLQRFRTGQYDLLRLYCGYYVAELLDKLTDKADKQPEIYDLAKTSLAALEDPEMEPRAVVLRLELQLLRMTGHLPSWRQCAQCGKSLTKQAMPEQRNARDNKSSGDASHWRYFSAFSGGIVCLGCRVVSRQTFRIAEGALDGLVAFSRDDWRRIECSHFPVGNTTAIRKLITQYLTTLLDRKFQLHDYLEELGR